MTTLRNFKLGLNKKINLVYLKHEFISSPTAIDKLVEQTTLERQTALVD